MEQLYKKKEDSFKISILYNLNLCSSKDVSGNDEISFTKGIIYKFSNEETTLISGFTGLKRCATIKDALPADEQFIKLISTINECKQGPCAFSIISAEGIESVIPKDYEIIIEGQKLTLQYKEEKVKTAEIKKEMCLFSDFREITLENSKPLTKLIFNNYIGAEFYAFDNKICVLPYTPEIKKQKAIAKRFPNLSKRILKSTLDFIEKSGGGLIKEQTSAAREKHLKGLVDKFFRP